VITGSILEGERAMIRLTVQGAESEQVVEAMLDTGFNGHLKLPESIIRALNLEYRRDAFVMLADDSIVTMPQYRARVDWHGGSRDILLLQSTGGPLAGMALIQGSRVTLDVVIDGAVTIEPLQGPS
jgi:predicted aspartyl protease